MMRWILILFLTGHVEARGVFSSEAMCKAVMEEHYKLTQVPGHCVRMPTDQVVTDITVARFLK